MIFIVDVLEEVGEDSDILERIVRDCMTTCMSSNKRHTTNYLMSDVLQMHGQSQRSVLYLVLYLYYSLCVEVFQILVHGLLEDLHTAC